MARYRFTEELGIVEQLQLAVSASSCFKGPIVSPADDCDLIALDDGRMEPNSVLDTCWTRLVPFLDLQEIKRQWGNLVLPMRGGKEPFDGTEIFFPQPGVRCELIHDLPNRTITARMKVTSNLRRRNYREAFLSLCEHVQNERMKEELRLNNAEI